MRRDLAAFVAAVDGPRLSQQQLAVAFSVEADVVPQPWRRFRAVDLPVANSDRNES